MYKKFLNLILFFLILSAFTLILNTHQANADGISLSLSPPLIQVRLSHTTGNKPQLTLQNQGNDPLSIKVLLKPFRPLGEGGQIEYFKEDQISNNYKKILSQIKLTDEGQVRTNFDLGPKQKKDLKLLFNMPEEEPTSDYYFSVVFLGREVGSSSQPPASPAGGSTFSSQLSTSKASSILNAGIASNIILSIGNEKPRGYIEEFSAPFLLQSGPVGFTVRVKNEGRNVIRPKGIILIKNIFGQTIARLDLDRVNVLSASTRSLTDTQTALARRSLGEGGSTPKVLWPEKFLLGVYTATLKLAISDQGPIYIQSIVFVALPINLVLGVLAAIIITIITIFRVRKRLKMEK